MLASRLYSLYIRANMQFNREITFTYRKTDGMRVALRIIPASDYSNTKKDTIWIFAIHH